MFAAATTTREAIWLKNLFNDLDYFILETDINVHNQSTICSARNPEFHKQTKLHRFMFPLYKREKKQNYEC